MLSIKNLTKFIFSLLMIVVFVGCVASPKPQASDLSKSKYADKIIKNKLQKK